MASPLKIGALSAAFMYTTTPLLCLSAFFQPSVSRITCLSDDIAVSAWWIWYAGEVRSGFTKPGATWLSVAIDGTMSLRDEVVVLLLLWSAVVATMTPKRKETRFQSCAALLCAAARPGKGNK